MNDKFVFSMWNYHPISKMSLDEMDVWAELGMTVPMLPTTSIERDDPKVLIPWLDRAKELGIKAIVNYGGMGYGDYANLGEEAYIKRIKPLYDALADHPALHGFCIGDEPFNKEALAASMGCIKANKKLAPHLTPYLNYTGATSGFDRDTLGGTLSDYMKRVYEETGTDEICFDEYGQQINDGGGKTGYMNNLKKFKAAAQAAGNADLWGCLLSSGHHVYTPPKEVDYRWQIHTTAALGLRGILWFRLYDKAEVNTYYGSPIDEFGDRTEAFYGMKRCQRRFLNHYGEIFMKLNYKGSYMVSSDRGVFPDYTEANHEVVKKVESLDEGLVSFFEDEEGSEYLCYVHIEKRFYGTVRVFYDKSKYYLSEVTLNGKHISVPNQIDADCIPLDDSYGEFSIMPAGLALFKIGKF